MENFTLTTSTGTVSFDGTTVVMTSADGATTTNFVDEVSVVATPVIVTTDTGITVTHADGTTADFVPAS